MAFIFFLPLIIIIGILTSLTDLKKKKIYNQHLVIGIALSIIMVAYATVFRQEDIIFHIINGGVACLISFLLFRSELWKGGDAKLFILYSFIMPVPTYNPVPFSSAINLFACSFLVGLIILSPVFIKDIIINYRGITTGLFSIQKRRALFWAIMQMFAYSWILYPVYFFLRINNPVVILMTSYLIFNGNYYLKKVVDNHYISKFFKRAYLKLLLCIVVGIFLRLWLIPDSLSYASLRCYFMMIALSGVLSVCMKTIFDYFEDYQDRVPFAPMLFIGCILSYTPFLTEVMKLAVIRNMLFQ